MGSKVLPSFIYESTVAWRIFENCLFRRANRRRKSAADSWQQVVVTYFQIFPALLFCFFVFFNVFKNIFKNGEMEENSISKLVLVWLSLSWKSTFYGRLSADRLLWHSAASLHKLWICNCSVWKLHFGEPIIRC